MVTNKQTTAYRINLILSKARTFAQHIYNAIELRDDKKSTGRCISYLMNVNEISPVQQFAMSVCGVVSFSARTRCDNCTLPARSSCHKYAPLVLHICHYESRSIHSFASPLYAPSARSLKLIA